MERAIWKVGGESDLNGVKMIGGQIFEEGVEGS